LHEFFWTVAVAPPNQDPIHWLDTLARLGLALFVGATIGLDRQLQHKPAGLRTHMLVSFGAALFAAIPIELGASYEALSRSAQGVATGVGFLGAGEILHKKSLSNIKGLTSAAAVWVSAALGFAAGCGLWSLATLGALLAFVVLRSGNTGLERPLRTLMRSRRSPLRSPRSRSPQTPLPPPPAEP
jgi:putative Mg2+ transporter-C (MgtC) family protein